MQLRRRLTAEVRLKILKYFPDRVLKTGIKENAFLAACPSLGKSVFEYEEMATCAEDYQSLVQDLLDRRTG